MELKRWRERVQTIERLPRKYKEAKNLNNNNVLKRQLKRFPLRSHSKIKTKFKGGQIWSKMVRNSLL